MFGKEDLCSVQTHITQADVLQTLSLGKSVSAPGTYPPSGLEGSGEAACHVTGELAGGSFLRRLDVDASVVARHQTNRTMQRVSMGSGSAEDRRFFSILRMFAF